MARGGPPARHFELDERAEDLQRALRSPAYLGVTLVLSLPQLLVLLLVRRPVGRAASRRALSPAQLPPDRSRYRTARHDVDMRADALRQQPHLLSRHPGVGQRSSTAASSPRRRWAHGRSSAGSRSCSARSSSIAGAAPRIGSATICSSASMPATISSCFRKAPRMTATRVLPFRSALLSVAEREARGRTLDRAAGVDHLYAAQRACRWAIATAPLSPGMAT